MSEGVRLAIISALLFAGFVYLIWRGTNSKGKAQSRSGEEGANDQQRNAGERTARSATQGSPVGPTTAAEEARYEREKIEKMRHNLRLKCMYNEELIDRLIDAERQRLPGAVLETHMQAAIERWERDNR